MELLDKWGIAEMLNTSPRSAVTFLERHGVYPINIGNGSKKYLRWRKIEIIYLLDTMQADTPRHKQVLPKVRKKEAETFLDLPMKELLATLTSQRNEPLLQ